MRLGLQELDWRYVGAKLAQDDNNAQVDFFRGFIKECLTWGTRHQVEAQLATVNHKLTPDERRVIGMVGYEGGE